MAEKGVGRLAVHKLGKRIILETQAKGNPNSYRIKLNWADLISESEYIQDTFCKLKLLESHCLEETCTCLMISELKKENWSEKRFKRFSSKDILN